MQAFGSPVVQTAQSTHAVVNPVQQTGTVTSAISTYVVVAGNSMKPAGVLLAVVAGLLIEVQV